jgi:hypothetical protein
MRHGKGTMRWKDGACYDGEWKQGIAQGQGKFTSANGDIYTGKFVANNASGHGTMILKENQTTYTGAWVKDQQHGIGEEKYNNGASFTGNFKEGHKNGFGIYNWADKSTY